MAVFAMTEVMTFFTQAASDESPPPNWVLIATPFIKCWLSIIQMFLNILTIVPLGLLASTTSYTHTRNFVPIWKLMQAF